MSQIFDIFNNISIKQQSANQQLLLQLDNLIMNDEKQQQVNEHLQQNKNPESESSSQIQVMLPKPKKLYTKIHDTSLNKDLQIRIKENKNKSITNLMRNSKRLSHQINQSLKNNNNPTHIISAPHKKGKKNIKTQPNNYVNRKYDQSIHEVHQLKMIYQRKNKLHQKLMRLNQELQQLNKSNSRYIGDNSLSIQESRLNKKQLSTNLGYPFSDKPNHKQLKRRNNIFLTPSNRDSRINTYARHQKQSQTEKAKKALDFIRQISKQSFQRRMKHHKAVNTNIKNQVLNHVCVKCSRTKCRAEVIEGELHQY